MADQIVITEKTSQAKDVRAAVGSRYGDILPAEGHLFDLLEPEDVVPAWKRWSPILLRPEGLYGTRRPRAATKPPSSKPFARRCARPNGSGSRPTAIARVSSSARRSSSITSIAARSCECCSPRRIRRRSATHSPGEAKRRIRQPLRRRRRAPAGRPDLQPVADPDRDRHSGPRGAGRDRGRPGQDANFGNRVQARAGNPEFRAAGLF